MRTPRETLVFAGMMIAASMLARATAAQMPDAVAAPGKTVVATLHAEGAQVYECKTESGGKLVWQFREPIATLLLDGKTVGRHYAATAVPWSGSQWAARRRPPLRTFRGSGSRSPSGGAAGSCRA
jgi:hypothetical protein